MNWASYEHFVPGLVVCEPCAIRNFKEVLEEWGDVYDEADLETLESSIALVRRLNERDGDLSDSVFAPRLFKPSPGSVCEICQTVSRESVA